MCISNGDKCGLVKLRETVGRRDGWGSGNREGWKMDGRN